MKTKVTATSLHRTLAVVVAAAGLATLGVSNARAQADLTFSGGLGAPLHLTLAAPVTYVVTKAGSGAPYFDFEGVGNTIGGGYNVSGNITFTINGGTPQTLSIIANGIPSGHDAYLYGALPGVAVGDTVVLNAGTLTTTTNFTGASPANGSFPTYLFDSAQDIDSANGVSVTPEPSTWALLGVGAGLLGLTLRQRRAAHLG